MIGIEFVRTDVPSGDETYNIRFQGDVIGFLKPLDSGRWLGHLDAAMSFGITSADIECGSREECEAWIKFQVYFVCRYHKTSHCT